MKPVADGLLRMADGVWPECWPSAISHLAQAYARKPTANPCSVMPAILKRASTWGGAATPDGNGFPPHAFAGAGFEDCGNDLTEICAPAKILEPSSSALRQ